MQSAVADGAANRVLQQLAQRAMRNDLQSAQNMQTALEAMGLLEDSAAPLSNPPAPAAPGNAAPEGGNNPPADPMDADRGRSEQLASASADPSHSISAPSTSRAGFATATLWSHEQLLQLQPWRTPGPRNPARLPEEQYPLLRHMVRAPLHYGRNPITAL